MAVAQQHGDRRIVVGVDGSPSSREALRWAVRQAALTGSVVDAVIAWHDPASYGGYAWLIAPIQRHARQVLTAIEKQPDGLHRTSVCEVLYVSLQGPFGAGGPQAPPPALIVTARPRGHGPAAGPSGLHQRTSAPGPGRTRSANLKAGGRNGKALARCSCPRYWPVSRRREPWPWTTRDSSLR
jgi:hypothetical protein